MASNPPIPPIPGPPVAPPPRTGPASRRVAAAPARKAPEKNAYPNPVEFSFEYWFNYFYAELPTHRQLEFFERISPAANVYRAAAAVPDGEKKTLLDAMMKLGFKAYPATLAEGKLTAEQMFASLKSMTRPEPSRVMFRGDSREPDQIKTNAGTKPQTQLAHLAVSRNFDKTWHPWNDTNRGNLSYFRAGEINQDNCLFSAISVTPEFYIATKFPMLPQGPIGKAEVVVHDLSGGTSKVADRIAQYKRAVQHQETRFLPCTRTNIYAVKVKKGWNTESFQAQTFPERAYNNLRWVDHFAVVKVIRIHYSNNSNDGHLTLVESYKLLPDDSDYDAHVRSSMKKLNLSNRAAVDTLIQNLRTFLRDVERDCKLRPDGTGGHVYLPDGVRAPFTILKVKSMRW